MLSKLEYHASIDQYKFKDHINIIISSMFPKPYAYYQNESIVLLWINTNLKII